MRAPTPAEALRAIWNDPARLEQWTLEKLDELYFEQELRDQELEESRKGWEFLIQQDPVEVAKARRDIAALRRLFPPIAEFIHAPPPKKRHGNRINAVESYGDPSSAADADAKLIRKLWREWFGESRRKADPIPEEIAARRNGVTVHQLDNFRKSKHR